MAVMQFSKGDYVRHMTGGPVMVVIAVLQDTITCQWFDRNDNVQNQDFDTTSIKIFQPPKREFRAISL